MKGHIAKKGNRYYAVVYVNGKPKWHSIPGVKVTRKDAEKFLNELVYRLNNNTYVDAKKMTFGELLNKWLASRKLAPKTCYRYKEIIDLHLAPALGEIRLDRLQPLHLQDYYQRALKEGRIGLKNASSPGLSGTTLLQHHRIIHCALQQAVMWELLSRNVADAVIPPKKEKPVLFEPALEVIFEVLDALKEELIYMPVVLAISAGVRRGEVLGLRWKDYNEKTKKISIVQTLQRVQGEGLKFFPPKTPGSRRQVELPPSTVAELKKHRTNQKKYKLALGDAYQDYGLICCWDDGRPIDPDYVTKRFEKITERLGCPKFRFHDLRHAHATFLLASGVDPKSIQDRLGHSTVAFTLDQYSHVTSSMQQQAAAKAEEIFFKVEKVKEE